MPVHGGSLGLARKFFHLLHRLTVPRDDNGFDLDGLLRKIIDDIDAPRAAGFDVENG